MAQQLWLLRHGEAEPHDARPDPERRLTARGEEQSRAAGVALRALEVHFHLVFASPKERALQTARLACETLGCAPVETEVLAAGFDADDARQLLLEAAPDGRILVVGHNPDFEQVVHDLTGGGIDFKKGGIAAVRLDGSAGDLIVLLRPLELDRIAAGH